MTSRPHTQVPTISVSDGLLAIQWRTPGVLVIIDPADLANANYSIKTETGHYSSSGHSFSLFDGLPGIVAKTLERAFAKAPETGEPERLSRSALIAARGYIGSPDARDDAGNQAIELIEAALASLPA
jgi:hypothetical protein